VIGLLNLTRTHQTCSASIGQKKIYRRHRLGNAHATFSISLHLEVKTLLMLQFKSAHAGSAAMIISAADLTEGRNQGTNPDVTNVAITLK
jgi:hypothetical protein